MHVPPLDLNFHSRLNGYPVVSSPYFELCAKILACAIVAGIIFSSTKVGVAAGLLCGLILITKNWTTLTPKRRPSPRSPDVSYRSPALRPRTIQTKDLPRDSPPHVSPRPLKPPE